ncbi:hypothetical protein BQ8482_360029 [Mesorhizobium delmotii]|uniref:Uncharacterized protein n=1 Tax=Mesorhizobium delmotii TaxID=1631247 RepID=A0A2P9AR34_9HYPH|nr:hypothetical protein BQ8482_360029 [Mesorhizobium delmotii]
MVDDLLDVITVATTGIVCFFIALTFGLDTIPALLSGGAGSPAYKQLSSVVCALLASEGLPAADNSFERQKSRPDARGRRPCHQRADRRRGSR